MHKVIDLFAGAGGLSHGFLQTKKYKIELAIEQNLSAQQTYMQNHPAVEIWDDINSFDDLYSQLDDNKYKYFGYTSFQKKSGL